MFIYMLDNKLVLYNVIIWYGIYKKVSSLTLIFLMKEKKPLSFFFLKKFDIFLRWRVDGLI